MRFDKWNCHRLSWRSAILALTAFILFCLLPLYQHLVERKNVKAHGMMSSQSIAPQDSAALKLLREDPDSFWNCDLPDTACRYFRPYTFFWDEDGAGSTFADDYERLGGKNKNLPAMTALSWWKDDDELTLPHNMSFIHVHKCGGTTVKAILAQTKNKLSDKSKKRHASLNNYKYSFGGGSSEQKERNQQRRQNHIEEMTNLQLSADAVVFSFVRDPIERFVSAVQQVMHYNDDFRKACLKWTARSTLVCAIDYTRTTNYLRDVHLVPMATHFRLWDADHKAKVAVLHLQDLALFAEYMAHATARNTTFMPHGRDRTKVEYATSSVLAHMSVAKDCTPDMIADLCELYAVDVVMMTSLGYASQYCK